MGSKRVGLARMQALIENLKRELTMTGTTLKDAAQVRKVKEVTAATTLTNADSGAIVNLSNSDYAVNLPKDPDVGCTFTFLHVAALSADGTINIDAKDGSHFFKGRIEDGENDTPSHVAFNGSSHDQVKFAASAAALDNQVTCTYVGSNIWLVHDSISFDISDMSAGTASGNA